MLNNFVVFFISSIKTICKNTKKIPIRKFFSKTGIRNKQCDIMDTKKAFYCSAFFEPENGIFFVSIWRHQN